MIKYNALNSEIIIPTKKRLYLLIFFMMWLIGWCLGELVVLGIILNEGIDFVMILWLIAWTFSGLLVIALILWILFGKEVIKKNHQVLVIEKRLLFFSRRKEYDCKSIQKFYIQDQPNSIFSSRSFFVYHGISGGKICFEYGMETIKFGSNIDMAEAKYLVENVLTLQTN